MAQDVERGHARRHVQRVVDRRQHDANAKANLAGALAHRCKCEVGGAVVRPHRAEMVFGKPHARKTLLFGIGNLLQRFMDPLGFTGPWPGLRNLDLVKETNSHGAVSF